MVSSVLRRAARRLALLLLLGASVRGEGREFRAAEKEIFLKSPPPPSPPPSPPPFPPPFPPLYHKSSSEAYLLLLYATILAYHAHPLTKEDRPIFIPEPFWPPGNEFGDYWPVNIATKLLSYPWVFVLFVVLFAFIEEFGKMPGQMVAQHSLLAETESQPEPPASLRGLANMSAWLISLTGSAPSPATADIMREPIPSGLARAIDRAHTAASRRAHAVGAESSRLGSKLRAEAVPLLADVQPLLTEAKPLLAEAEPLLRAALAKVGLRVNSG